jgi:hypothetical protein
MQVAPLSQIGHLVESISYLQLMFGTKQFEKNIVENNGNFYLYFPKMLKIEPPTCEKIFIIPNMELLLQIHKKRCIFHSYSPMFEKNLNYI